MDQLRDVSNILWRERNLLELLAFKLDSERLLARAGRTQWLARADHEVEVVLGSLKAVELERGILVQALAVELDLATEPTLVALAERVPAEWAGIFADHRRALLELARDVDRSARRSRRQMEPVTVDATVEEDDERGAVAVSRAVADIVMPPRGQSATDEHTPPRLASSRRSHATARPDAVVARIPSLVDFLR
ncbi:MAG TPA: flagellar protein FlgN [Acidimicrobiia bacterium]